MELIDIFKLSVVLSMIVIIVSRIKHNIEIQKNAEKILANQLISILITEILLQTMVFSEYSNNSTVMLVIFSIFLVLTYLSSLGCLLCFLFSILYQIINFIHLFYNKD